MSVKSTALKPSGSFNWKNIPHELRYLAPKNEPVCKDSALDTHLKRLWVANKDSLCCSMLTSSKKDGCSIKGKLESKGYAGAAKKFQVRCNCCRDNLSWASKRGDNPSLAELVYSTNKRRVKRANEERELREFAAKINGVSGSERVQNERQPELLNTVQSERQEWGVEGQHQVGEVILVKEVLNGIEIVIKEDVDCSQEVLNETTDSQVTCGTDVSYLPDEAVPETWEDIKNEEQENVSKISGGKRRIECLENDSVFTEEYIDGEFERYERIRKAEEESKQHLPVRVDIDLEALIKKGVKDCEQHEMTTVYKLIEIVTALRDEVKMLKEDKKKCCPCKVTFHSDSSGIESKEYPKTPQEEARKHVDEVRGRRPSFAAVAANGHIATRKFNKEVWDRKVQRRTEQIQENLKEDEKISASSAAESILKLEAKPRRKEQKLLSLFVFGLKKERYSVMREHMREIGVKTSKLLNMVWRGEVLEVIVPEESVASIKKCFGNVSKTIRLSEKMNWEKLFTHEGKKRSKKDVKRMVDASSESLVANSRYQAKSAAKVSSKEAQDAFAKWSQKEVQEVTLNEKQKIQIVESVTEASESMLIDTHVHDAQVDIPMETDISSLENEPQTTISQQQQQISGSSPKRAEGQ